MAGLPIGINTVKADAVLKAGQRMEFSVQSDDQNFYSSRLQDYDDKSMMVDMPYNEQRVPIIPRAGEKVMGKILGKEISYRFFAVFKKAVAGSLPLWILEKPKTVERFQERDYVRMKASLPVIMRPLDDDGSVLDRIKTSTIDISGGGVCVTLNRGIKVGNRVTLEIDNIPGMEMIQILGEVARSQNVKARGAAVYHIGIKFIELPAMERNKLVKFVFDLQRKNLRQKSLR